MNSRPDIKRRPNVPKYPGVAIRMLACAAGLGPAGILIIILVLLALTGRL